MQQTPNPVLDSLFWEETVEIALDQSAKQALTSAQKTQLAIEANQWLKQGVAHKRQGNIVAALADFEKALQTYKQLEHTRSVAQISLVMAHLCYSLADYLWAVDCARQGFEMARRLSNPSLMQQTLSCLGNSYRHFGEFGDGPNVYGAESQLGSNHRRLLS
jgi:tetratricopeptide (TPR) repeat protein